MKVEAGRTYKVKSTGRVFKVERVENYWGGMPGKAFVKAIDDSKMNGDEMVFNLHELENTELEDISTEDFVNVEPTHSSKPAHYDTAIDTIDFMKANFSREAVEGFMRGNAIKYLQRAGKKGDKIDDLKKSAHYLQMLIEWEEEK